MADKYLLEVVPVACRQLEQLPSPIQGRVRRAVRGLAADPRPPGAKLLSDVRRIWRIRVGHYRVLYEVRDDQLVVLVVGMGHRREVYRGPRSRG